MKHLLPMYYFGFFANVIFPILVVTQCITFRYRLFNQTIYIRFLVAVFYFILLFFSFFFKFYFILKFYIIVFVLPNIKMNPPQVYMYTCGSSILNCGCQSKTKMGNISIGNGKWTSATCAVSPFFQFM